MSILGGSAGPEGSSPPVTSGSYPGWGPNRTVLRYGTDGGLEDRYSLPDDVAGLGAPAVVAVGDDRFVIATACTYGPGCGAEVEPVRLQLVDGQLASRPLTLPPMRTNHVPGSGHLVPIGAQGSTLWVVQRIPPAAGDDLASILGYSYRLLQIDVLSGAGTEVGSPPGVLLPGLVCLMDDALFLVHPILDELSNPVGATIYRMPTAGGGWQPLTDITFQDPPPSGQVTCLPRSQQVVLASRSGGGTELRTYAADTGAEAAPLVSAEEVPTMFFELAGGGSVGVGLDDGALLARLQPSPGLAWEPIELDLPAQWNGVVGAAGHLFDVEHAIATTSGARIREIQIEAG